MPKPEQRLLALYDQLSRSNRDSLLAFAEFLQARQQAAGDPAANDEADEPLPAPLDIPRPTTETVVAAIRRLRETYPMVDRAAVFTPSSTLMTQHIVEGRDLIVVIDELEALFAREYRKLSATDPDRC